MISIDGKSWQKQKAAWKSLNGLHPAEIDLKKVDLARECRTSELLSSADIARLLCELGLNDEFVDEFPPALHPFCGTGLRIWQYPIQFAPYLVQLCKLRPRSYMEIGIRHGGSYIATVEILNRFSRLDFSVGVDIIPCPSMAAYKSKNSSSEFVCMDSRSTEFQKTLERLGTIDLVFIDSHHSEDQCRAEFELLRPCANMLAFHDIENVGCPGIKTVWNEIRQSSDYVCFEYTRQYENLGPYMGIGLAIKTRRFHEYDVTTDHS